MNAYIIKSCRLDGDNARTFVISAVDEPHERAIFYGRHANYKIFNIQEQKIIEANWRSLMYQVKFTKISPDAHIPTRANKGDACFDLYSSEDITIKAHDSDTVHTGLCFQLPEGTELQVRPRSGLAGKNKVTVLNTPGTIDEGYRGEIMVILINHSDTDFEVTKGMRIAQIKVAPVYETEYIEVESLSDTERGTGGFGSSGE